MTAPVVAVTGVTRGLGRALSAGLVASGAQVVMVCRDPERGESARRDIAAVAAGPRPELVVADLADLSSVRHAAHELRSAHDRVDALVNNAAVFTRTRQLSADGFELMFATNHLGPFLLTNLLLDPLRAATPGRVLTLTAPSTVPLDFDDLQGERSFKPLRIFGASKMANLLFTYELARRAGPIGVTANAIHPGLPRTALTGAPSHARRPRTATVDHPARLPPARDGGRHHRPRHPWRQPRQHHGTAAQSRHARRHQRLLA
jgi:NAD(P)-dependent dehydrogenase (short-subunit alcohol dehydrogenase family)